MFEASLQIRENRLEVRYAVENQTDAQMYLFDMVYRRDPSGEPQVDADLAYRCLRGRTLEIEKALQPIPHGLKVEIPDVPYLSCVGPGARKTGNMVADLPVSPFSAYTTLDRNETTETVGEVVFRLGYLLSSDIAEDEATVEAASHLGEDVYAADYGNAEEIQRFFEKRFDAPDGLSAFACIEAP